MPAERLLLVGLGNPGPKYAGNRHNIGFMALDAVVRRHGFASARARFHGELAAGQLAGRETLALKPLTYMNESGKSVAEAARFYKIALDDVFVFHDELDLAAGRLRVKQGGGAAGHNGLRSIDALFGNAYWRVRLGIGHPGDRRRVLGHVLDDFDELDRPWLEPLLAAVADHVPLLATGDPATFASKVALAMAPPKPERPKPKRIAAEGVPSPRPSPQGEGGEASATVSPSPSTGEGRGEGDRPPLSKEEQ